MRGRAAKKRDFALSFLPSFHSLSFLLSLSLSLLYLFFLSRKGGSELNERKEGKERAREEAAPRQRRQPAAFPLPPFAHPLSLSLKKKQKNRNNSPQTTYVKFHWKPSCGVKSLLDDEAERVGGANHSHATQDLFESIASGDYPEWQLLIQTMDPSKEDSFDFDPLDVTKIWPEDRFPLQPVGRMVLNKNPDNFFNENEMLVRDFFPSFLTFFFLASRSAAACALSTAGSRCSSSFSCFSSLLSSLASEREREEEKRRATTTSKNQALVFFFFFFSPLSFPHPPPQPQPPPKLQKKAFCPALVVPGIGYSDDKLLQTRIFSYADTQRHRLGPNYLLLPANAPRSAHHNNHHDGAMNFTHRDEEVNYFPSRMDPVRNAARTPTNPMPFSGKRERAVIVKENNFQQPGERFRSFDPARQERFIARLCGVIGDPRATPEIRRIWVREFFFLLFFF